jgi:cell division protein FtsW
MVFCVAALLALGLVMLYSSSMMEGGKYLVQQVVWCALGLVAAGILSSVDYRVLKKVSWVVYAVAIVLLLMVFAPVVGKRVNGASRWIGYAGLRFQPSELAKLAIIICLAHYGERFHRQMPTLVRGLILPGLLISLVLGLVFIEPDRGTTILLSLVSISMLIIAGTRARYLIFMGLVGVAFLVYSLNHDSMRKDRIYSWRHLEETRLDKGMQAYQARLALGAGGWLGVGLGNGRQKMGFVPEDHTDFILPIIGEELGAVATLSVVGLFVMLVASMMAIGLRAPDIFGMLLGGGVASLIGTQAFINIAVVTSVIPNKGMPLPFISYGGSNLFMMLVMTGILFSVARHSSEPAWSGAGQFEDLSQEPQAQPA